MATTLAHAPIASLDRATSSLAAYFEHEQKRRQERRSAFAKNDEQQRALLLDTLGPNKAKLQALSLERRAIHEARAQPKLDLRRRLVAPLDRPLGGDVAEDVGGAFIIRGAPYDFAWTLNNGKGTEAADQSTGTYGFVTQAIGSGEVTVAAGIGFWFHSQDANPRQRFAALYDYDYDWNDEAMAYVGHNDGRTHLGVFGVSEQAWLNRSNPDPTWSDGVGWLENHSGAGSDQVSADVQFNARADSWYQCWVYSSATLYADAGAFGFAYSDVRLNVTVTLGFVNSFEA
jgi:hypothetical protein